MKGFELAGFLSTAGLVSAADVFVLPWNYADWRIGVCHGILLKQVQKPQVSSAGCRARYNSQGEEISLSVIVCHLLVK